MSAIAQPTVTIDTIEAERQAAEREAEKAREEHIYYWADASGIPLDNRTQLTGVFARAADFLGRRPLVVNALASLSAAGAVAGASGEGAGPLHVAGVALAASALTAAVQSICGAFRRSRYLQARFHDRAANDFSASYFSLNDDDPIRREFSPSLASFAARWHAQQAAKIRMLNSPGNGRYKTVTFNPFTFAPWNKAPRALLEHDSSRVADVFMRHGYGLELE